MPSEASISANAANPPSSSTRKRRGDTDLSTSCCSGRKSLPGKLGAIGCKAVRIAAASCDGGNEERTTRSAED